MQILTLSKSGKDIYRIRLFDNCGAVSDLLKGDLYLLPLEQCRNVIATYHDFYENNQYFGRS